MKPEMKKLIIANLPYLLFVYLFGKLGQAYRLAEGIDLSQKLLHFADGCAAAFESAAPSFHPTDLLIGVAGAAALRLMVYCKGKNAKKYRKGVEYGSARWGGPKDIAPYIDPNFDNNILLTQTERITMNNRPKDPKTARNKNVLVIGGSGSGKTRFFVKPNLMQCVSKDYPTSFVITDPKGSLIGEVGQLLIRSSYRVKVLNTINFSKSMKYNPFRYLHSEKDVLKLVNTLICNTKGEGEKSAEDFWVKSERLFYTALIGYIWQEAPEEEMNFTTLLEMINASEAREDDPEFQSPVDLMFERLEEGDPDHFAVRQYKKFLLSAGKTRSSILISAGARMAPFDIREVRELMEDDELELDTIGDEKTALFLIMSDTDTTFNFILAMVQSQLINLLCDRADDKYGGRLPVHVRMILDEFANIGQIPNFDKLIATIRSREISASIILQSQSQLKAIYKDAAEIISDNCDCTLFLSGRGKNAKEKKDTLAQSQKRIAELDVIIKRLYEDNISGKLSDERFIKLSRDYELEQTNLTNLVEHLRQEVKEQEKQKVNVRQFIAAVRKYTDMQQLDAYILREFVDKIYISEVYTPDENEPRIKVREIEIVYNFIGAFDFEEAREQSQAAQKEKKTGVA